MKQRLDQVFLMDGKLNGRHADRLARILVNLINKGVINRRTQPKYNAEGAPDGEIVTYHLEEK